MTIGGLLLWCQSTGSVGREDFRNWKTVGRPSQKIRVSELDRGNKKGKGSEKKCVSQGDFPGGFQHNKIDVEKAGLGVFLFIDEFLMFETTTGNFSHYLVHCLDAKTSMDS